jgi:diguanylate cyclase (GGDEF)-like protein
MVDSPRSQTASILPDQGQANVGTRGPDQSDQARGDERPQLPPEPHESTAMAIEHALQSGFKALVFPAALESRYEQDTTRQRVKDLKLAGVAIAFLMNLFLVSDLAMVPDMFHQALTWRLGLYTPLILGSLLFLGKIRSVIWREVFVAQAGTLACAIQLALCVNSQSPHALAYLVGITMVIFFSNVYSRIRFWVALPVNGAYLGMFVLGVCFFPSVDAALVIPIGLMLASTSAFTLFYLYCLEHEERHNYLLSQSQQALAGALGQANKELERASRTDALTQVANRRHFDEFMSQLWARARHGSHAVSVLMLDLDHFKAYNDQYGHPMGDACLLAVAQALGQSLRRPGDLVARYGGEEFIAVLHKASPQQVEVAAERVRAAVEALRIAHEGSPMHGRVTISIGWASAPPGDREPTAHRLIAMADEALYQAKNRGRNRVWPSVSVSESEPSP